MDETTAPPQIVLCLPGPWADRTAFLQAIVGGTDGQYLFLGKLLMHIPTETVFDIDFEAHDARMSSAFASAGPHWRDTPDMMRIASHRSVVYLLGHGGSDADVRALMLAAGAVLDAGGLGVKVDSSGVAHSPDAWRTFCGESASFGPYRAFVVTVTGPGEAYSCGMHAFGLRDAWVVDGDMRGAESVAGTFSWYLYKERPAIREGQTFSCDAESPVYRIGSSAGPDHPADSLFVNPCGTWRLERIAPD